MREILDQLFASGSDPIEAARRNMRPRLRQRFYRTVGVAEIDGFCIVLDGKPVRTPARRPLAAPSGELAQAIAAEWEAQREVVDPARMPLTRLANVIIDGVADAPQAVAEEIGKFLASDLLCYRAEAPQPLVERQARAWNPVIDWARDTLRAHFLIVTGVTFVTQPAETIAAAREAIPDEPWALGALASATALTGSALLALALWHGRLTVEQAWEAAHVDEDWNMEHWGSDTFALERRAARLAELQAAHLVIQFS
jgi:chaperone required for assembly of F1-ATPase